MGKSGERLITALMALFERRGITGDVQGRLVQAPGIGGGAQPEAVRALLEFMGSADSADAKRHHGMEPA
jgi:hypothetical protein